MSAWPESERRHRNRVAIVDFHLGNLFSVQQACAKVGLSAVITSERRVVDEADAVILPGMGAFGDAMDNLRSLGLVEALCEIPASGRPLIGLCLGLQLLMRESEEFGRHRGLGLIDGTVQRFAPTKSGIKVPQIGWNRVHPPHPAAWQGTPLEGQPDGVYMYFVHSFYVTPAEGAVVSATTSYGGLSYCSAVSTGTIHAYQFHPERSGPAGLAIYRQIAVQLLAKEAISA
jgi:glutamine amidotransferase